MENITIPTDRLLSIQLITQDEASDSSAPTRPQGRATLGVPVAPISRRPGVVIADRDLVWLEFLSRFRWANATQLARLTASPVKGVAARLDKLSAFGVLVSHNITKGMKLYTPTQLGLSMVSSDFDPVETIYPSSIGHELGLNSLAIDVERGEAPSLVEEPSRTVSTREMLSADLNLGLSMEKRWEAQRELVRTWGESTALAGAGIHVLYWEAENEVRQHVPDLVIPQPDGESAIAIELELTRKADSRVRATLLGYKWSETQFSRLVWFTHNHGIAAQVKRLAAEVDVPITLLKYSPQKAGQPFWG